MYTDLMSPLSLDIIPADHLQYAQTCLNGLDVANCNCHQEYIIIMYSCYHHLLKLAKLLVFVCVCVCQCVCARVRASVCACMRPSVLAS